MKAYFRLLMIVFTLVVVTACCPKDGDRGPQGVPGTPGVGTPGNPGAPGNPGNNGHSIAFKIDAADVSLCTDGGSVFTMGLDMNDDLTLQTSEAQQAAVVCNGHNGSDGTDGTDGQDAPPTAFSPIGLVNACGDAPGIDDEVFIRLQNGMLLWSQSNNGSALTTRLAVARPGTWTTTDTDNCVFTLDADFNITYENHHY